jgi:hypothetical protein
VAHPFHRKHGQKHFLWHVSGDGLYDKKSVNLLRTIVLATAKEYILGKPMRAAEPGRMPLRLPDLGIALAN